jgi:hypothetical protein
MGFSKARIVRGLRAIERVPGRLEPVPNDEVKRVFVDYAHTPDALERVLGALRPLTKGRLIVVFGCGGDRDREKRPLMGRAVARVADLAIITNDNPRTEDPVAIAQAIEGGMAAEGWARMELVPRAKTFRVELDRRVAIRVAIGWLEADDVLVLAGKGHEDYQIVGKEKRHFDDREEAWRILAGLPPPLPEAAAGTNDLATSVDDAQVIDALDLATPSARSMPTTEIHADDIEQILEAEPPGAEDGNGEAEDVDAEQVEAIVSAPAMPVILAVAPSTGSARAEAEVVSSDAEKTGPRADALKPPPVAAVGPPEDPKT